MNGETAVLPRIDGIHHVTAIASDPQQNLDFYVRFLGMRLVKRTVNFDDPGEYRVHCIHSATLSEQTGQKTMDLLTNLMGFGETSSEGDRIRLQTPKAVLQRRSTCS